MSSISDFSPKKESNFLKENNFLNRPRRRFSFRFFQVKIHPSAIF